MGHQTNPRLGLTSWRLPVPRQDAPRIASASGASTLQVDYGGGARGAALTSGRLAQRLLGASTDLGVTITTVALNVLNDIGITSSSLAARTQSQSVLTGAIESAQSIHAGALLVPSFRKSTIRTRRDLENTAAFLAEATVQARSAGLVILTENVLPPTYLKLLIALVADPNLRVLVDLGNLVEHGVDVRMYADAADFSLHTDIHAKDVKNGNTGFCALGTGDVPFAETIPWLVNAHEICGFVIETDHRNSDLTAIAQDLKWLSHLISCTTKGIRSHAH